MADDTTITEPGQLDIDSVIPYRATVVWDHGTEIIEGSMPLPLAPPADQPRRGPSRPSTR
ncbi:hypothetical protein [Nevskia sp.]|uniref:hypothetical protein n=1 Tax=Nevskia sp. TaxID=1929292 RepID=UPI0025E89D6A|nr:hypothetical protein [Nevskia sp.]